MKKNVNILITSILLLSALAACSQPVVVSEPTTVQQVVDGASADAVEVEQTTLEPVEQENAAEADSEPPAEDAPVAGTAYQLSAQQYSPPSNAFSLNLPEGWNCSETGQYRVDCYNADNTALMSVRAIGTGYELLQEHFLSMVMAELVTTYGEVKAYTEVSKTELEGTLINEATWREGEVYWQGLDRYVREGPAVYCLRFAAVQQNFEGYRTLFEEVVQKAALNSSVMSNALMYAPRREYEFRDMYLNIQVPTSWTRFVDIASLERTTVEGFLSPDQRASVQVVIFAKGSVINQDTKSAKTLEIMHDLYGWDMRVDVDKAYQDGREYLEWYSKMKGISGRTYFDTVGTSLYIFSVIWDDDAKYLYDDILQEVLDSFALE